MKTEGLVEALLVPVLASVAAAPGLAVALVAALGHAEAPPDAAAPCQEVDSAVVVALVETEGLAAQELAGDSGFLASAGV